MGSFSESNFYVDIEICNIFRNQFINFGLSICAHRCVQHCCNFEGKFLVNQQAYNLWPVFVWKIFDHVLQNFLLTSWVTLHYFLKISRNLPYNCIIIN